MKTVLVILSISPSMVHPFLGLYNLWNRWFLANRYKLYKSVSNWWIWKPSCVSWTKYDSFPKGVHGLQATGNRNDICKWKPCLGKYGSCFFPWFSKRRLKIFLENMVNSEFDHALKVPNGKCWLFGTYKNHFKTKVCNVNIFSK